MSLPSIFNSMSTVLREVQAGELLKTNRESGKYGLTLSGDDVREIVEVRDQVLQSYGRLELDIGVTVKIIQAFCTSSYISQEDYADIIKELQEVFYYMKNETGDEIGDDALIAIMKDYFENSCHGSVELLQGREMEEFARGIRCGGHERGALL